MIERSMDFRRIKRLAPWALCISDKVYYLIDSVNGEDVGIWLFHPNSGGFQVHAYMTEGHRGRRAAQSVRECFTWIFTHTDAKKIVAAIPRTYKEVHVMARHVGMKFDGFDTRTFRCYSLDKRTFEQEKSNAE